MVIFLRGFAGVNEIFRAFPCQTKSYHYIINMASLCKYEGYGGYRCQALDFHSVHHIAVGSMQILRCTFRKLYATLVEISTTRRKSFLT